MNLPLFPLHAVLFPGVEMSLHVFEERYRTMVERCVADQSPFGVVLIREGREVGSGELAVAAVGTAAEIRVANRHSDGRYDLVARGTHRFRLDRVDHSAEPYLVGQVAAMDDVVGEPMRVDALRQRVVRLFIRYIQAVQTEERVARERGSSLGQATSPPPDGLEVAGRPWTIGGPVGAESTGSAAADAGPDDADPDDAGSGGVGPALGIPRDPTELSYVLSGIVHVEMLQRQGLLEMPTTELRLVELERLLERKIALLQRGLGTYVADPRLAAIRRN